MNAKTLTPSITANEPVTKVYDGTTDVTAELEIELDGVIDGDDVTAEAESYTYDDANEGDNKTITANGVKLEGEHAVYYKLANGAITTTGSITKAKNNVAKTDTLFNDVPCCALNVCNNTLIFSGK